MNRIGQALPNSKSESFGKLKIWKCPKCGTENEAENNFCGECGTKKPKTSTWNCPNCGKKEIESSFCPDCGTKKPGVKNPAKFSGLLLSVAILFAVWTIIKGRYIFFNNDFFYLFTNLLFFFIPLPWLIYLSASTLIFAKKEKWLFIPFGALSIITFVRAVSDFFHIFYITSFEAFSLPFKFFLLFEAITYVIITLESFKVFKNRRPSSVLSIAATVTVILSTIPLFVQYVYMLENAMMSSSGLFISSFVDIIHTAALILYLRWLSKRKDC